MVEPLNTKAWVLVKRGVYWRPEAQGYTYFKAEAGRYSDEEASAYVEHDASNGNTSKIRWDDAPELSPGCTDEAARRFYESRVQLLEAENEKLREALKPFAEYLDEVPFDLDNHGNPLPDDTQPGWTYLKARDFRAARNALKENGNG